MLEASLMATLDTLDVQLKDLPTSSSLLVQYDNTQSKLSLTQAKLVDIWQSIYSTRHAESKTILSQLSSMTAISLPHANANKVWKMYVKYQGQNKSLSAEEIAELKDIAGYCPEEGGDAVYFAIDLFGVVTGKHLATVDCPNGKKGLKITNDEHSNTFLSIYPNPGQERLTITQDDELELTIQLIDMTGRVMSTSVSFDKKTTLNTSSLPNGFYIIDVKSQNGEVNQSFRWLKTN